MENFGKKLTALRRSKKVTQERLAEVLDVSRQTVSRWEADLSQPTAENLKDMSDFFGVDANYFLGYEISVTQTEETSTAAETDDGAYRIEKRKVNNIFWSVILAALSACAAVCILVGSLTINDNIENAEIGGFAEWFGIFCLVIGLLGAVVLITVLSFIIFNTLKNKKNKQQPKETETTKQ